jgi:hypothetical protein
LADKNVSWVSLLLISLGWCWWWRRYTEYDFHRETKGMKYVIRSELG